MKIIAPGCAPSGGRGTAGTTGGLTGTYMKIHNSGVVWVKII